MDSIHYSLSSNAYKNNIFTGFSQLQNREEFVDLTLAADGYIFKVHRNLVALASPYLRDILRSISNHSPVIFLNNVNHKILSYLLEYIYQGEANIPVDSVGAFIEVSKSLHIAGIEDLEPPNMKLPRKLTAKRKKSPEKRTIPANIVMNNGSMEVNTTALAEVQQNVENKSDNLENNYNYETDCSMQDQQQSNEIIKNAQFIVQQNQESCNYETVHNATLIDMQTESSQINVHTNNDNYMEPNLLQSQPVLPDHLNTDTNQNIPVIEITSDAPDHLQTNTSQFNEYKIILKSQSDQTEKTEALKNIPVIEIQHCASTVQQDQNTTFQEYLLPAHAPIETSMNLNQNNNALPQKNRSITVLDEIIIKSGVCSSEMNVCSGQVPSGGMEVTGISSDTKVDMNDMKNMTQFSVTERGALQLVLNRFLYCCHHSSRFKQRWRCIDYRRGKCVAVVDTVDGAIVARLGVHAHPFHDKQIFKKHKKGLIYQTIELALIARNSAQKEGLKTLSIDETDEDDT